MNIKNQTVTLIAMLAVFAPVLAQESVDYDMVNRIRHEGFNNSEALESLRVLTDEIGPRLTASPGMRAASQWTVEQLKDWGLENVRLEEFAFGRGWSPVRSEIHMTSPRRTQLYGLPIQWHPGTGGVLEAEIVYAPINCAEDYADCEAGFAEWAGQLAGKIVLIDDIGEPSQPAVATTDPLTPEELAEEFRFDIPVAEAAKGDDWTEFMNFRRALMSFLAAEGAAAMVMMSPHEEALIQMTGYQYHDGKTPEFPAVMLAKAHYQRLVRLADNEHNVSLSLDVEVTFHDDDHNGYNTIAEIPGEGRNPEIVMAGAHIDSHSPGDGASDNAFGVAVIMEAVRILKALEVEPKRTIRIGLWSGEESEYWGSAKHVRDNFGYIPRLEGEEADLFGDYEAADLGKPFVKGRDYDRFSAYFNLDNSAGKVRGIYTEGNAAVRPIFEAWLQPFHDLDATHVSANNTGGTDHESFQLIGLPGYQFIQDRSKGDARYHNQLDLFDPSYEADLKQASVIMASFLYHAAMRDDRMPRKPEPRPLPDE